MTQPGSKGQRLGERIVNDVHSRLNPTVVAEVVAVASLQSLQEARSRR